MLYEVLWVLYGLLFCAFPALWHYLQELVECNGSAE